MLHSLSAVAADSFVRSRWQVVHGFGMPYLAVSEGEIKRNVWLRTFTFEIVRAICGIWQSTHRALSGLW